MATILLDAGLIGLACSHPGLPTVAAFRAWLRTKLKSGNSIAIADVSRYEARRELVRIDATAKLRRLDELADDTEPIPVRRRDWDRASELWAEVRRQGRPTAAPDALDGDAILAAVALGLSGGDEAILIATTNVQHLAWFGVDARTYPAI